jgi:hypothetical protein
MNMLAKIYLGLCLVAACGGAPGQGNDELAAKMMNDCQALARELNRSKQLGIRTEGLQPLFTWRAACAERPPTGPGDVTALCEGKRVTSKGEKGVFFWQKSDRGRLNEGYFDCDDESRPFAQTAR